MASRVPRGSKKTHSTPRCPPASCVFQEAREKVSTAVDTLMRALSDKKSELLAEIDRLEREFVNKQQQQQKDLVELRALKAQTEGLRQNKFKDLQSNVSKELQKGIQKLTCEIRDTRQEDCGIEIGWGMCLSAVLSQINQSAVSIASKESYPPSDTRPLPKSTPLPIDVDYDLIPFDRIPNI